MLRCYGLSKEPFPDQGLRATPESAVGFGDVLLEVLKWVNELLYPDGNTYESSALETSVSLYFAAQEKDSGEEVYVIDVDLNTPLNMIMPKRIETQHMVPYAVFCLLANHWYGEDKVRVMCANIPVSVWRQAFYLYRVILGVVPVDCRSGSPSHTLEMHFEPDPLRALLAPSYRLEPGGTGIVGTMEANQRLIVSSGLGLLEPDVEPNEGFNQAVYETIAIQPLRINRDEAQVQPPPAEVEAVPLADPVDTLYHAQFAQCRDILVQEPHLLMVNSTMGGTGKTRIVQQLATTLAVPYLRLHRVLTQDGDLHPELVHAYLNGGLVHICVDSLDRGISPDTLVLNDLVEGVQMLPLSMVDRPEKPHPDCYFVLESTLARGSRNYSLAKLLIRFAPYSVDVDLDKSLRDKLNPAHDVSESRLSHDLFLLINGLRDELARKADFDMGLHVEAVFRSLTSLGRTPKNALQQLVSQNPLLNEDTRKKLLAPISALSNKGVSKKIAAPKPGKAAKAKTAENATPDEQAQNLRNIVAPVLALPPVPAVPQPEPEPEPEPVPEPVADELTIEW